MNMPALFVVMLFATGFTLIEELGIPWTPKPTLVQGCCEVCHAGKACGDSCISRSKRCHKGSGCACDG